jgi:hypothetical protein
LSIYLILASLGPGVHLASTRSRKIIFLGSEVQPVHRADNIAAICGQLSGQCGILNISLPYRPPKPVTGIAFTELHMSRKQIIDFTIQIACWCQLFLYWNKVAQAKVTHDWIQN